METQKKRDNGTARKNGFWKKATEGDNYLESLKKIAEILAFGTAVYFGFTNYILKDRPSLEKLAGITSELNIDTVTKKQVHLNYLVTIKNAGKSSFNISHPVSVKLWLIPIDTLVKNHFMNWMKYMEGKPADTSVLSGSFIAHYVPDQEITYGFDFYLDNNPQKAVLISAFSEFESYELIGKNKIWYDTTFATRTRCIPDSK